MARFHAAKSPVSNPSLNSVETIGVKVGVGEKAEVGV
jgi:hypothetical protein